MSQVLLLIISLHTSFCSLPNRSDYIEELFTSNEDSRGDWSTTIYCNYDEYAIGYELNVQGPRGVLDDTAANSLRLTCSDSETLIANLENTNGDWSSITCPSNSYITSYSSKVENAQGGGDDTSLNSVSAICNDPSQTIIETSNAGQWGGFSDYVSCSNNAAVCGFRQNVQAPKIGDNSGLQAVRFQCCSLPTMNPTKEPSISPSISPIGPSFGPTMQPSIGPSFSTITPSNMPSISPTNNPSLTPSIAPSYSTQVPTYIPTLIPTINPTITPTNYPTTNPTDITSDPTNNPTEPEKRTDMITSGIVQSTTAVFVKDKLKEKQNNITSIILTVLGIFVLLIICVFCGCFYIKWRKSKIEKEKVHTELTVVSSLQSGSNLSSISREEQKQSVLEDVDFKVMENINQQHDDDDVDDDIVAYCNTKGNDTKGNNNMEQQIVDTESDEMPENEDMRMELGNTTNGYDENIAEDAFIVQDNVNNEGGTPEKPMNDEIIDNGHTVH